MSVGYPSQLGSRNTILMRLSVLITIAWLMALANFLSVLLCIPHGWGQHAWNVTIQDATKLNRYLLPIMITYVWCPVLTRLAILSVLYRIDPSRWFRISAYAIAFAVVVYSVTFTVLLSGPCNPIDAGANNCLINLGLAQVLLSIFSDVAVIILPIPTLWKLQMPFRKKMLTGGILTLGSGVLLATIARAPYMKLLVSSTDFTQTMAEIGVVSALELNLGIVCNNLMRMKPFISRYFPNLFIKLGLSTRNLSNIHEQMSPINVEVDSSSHSSKMPNVETEMVEGAHQEFYGIDAESRSLELDNRSTKSILG
ncbi:integral membrane protein [Ilyonectria robusta]